MKRLELCPIFEVTNTTEATAIATKSSTESVVAGFELSSLNPIKPECKFRMAISLLELTEDPDGTSDMNLHIGPLVIPMHSYIVQVRCPQLFNAKVQARLKTLPDTPGLAVGATLFKRYLYAGEIFTLNSSPWPPLMKVQTHDGENFRTLDHAFSSQAVFALTEELWARQCTPYVSCFV